MPGDAENVDDVGASPSSTGDMVWGVAGLIALIAVIFTLIVSFSDAPGRPSSEIAPGGWDDLECRETMEALADGYERSGESVSQARRDALVENNC
jgi:hypothetical protein